MKKLNTTLGFFCDETSWRIPLSIRKIYRVRRETVGSAVIPRGGICGLGPWVLYGNLWIGRGFSSSGPCHVGWKGRKARYELMAERAQAQHQACWHVHSWRILVPIVSQENRWGWNESIWHLKEFSDYDCKIFVVKDIQRLLKTKRTVARTL